jgi:uncharacterized protein YkwD
MRLRRFWRALNLCAAAVLPSTALAQSPSALERALLDEHNAVRTDPAGYAAHLEALLPYFEGNVIRRPGSRVGLQTNEGPAAVREAIRALRQQQPVPPLEWADGLWRAARDHARDQGPRGATGHDGGDGSSMDTRMRRYGAWNGTAAENIDYGSPTAREVLISLIVDDGVPSRGHRRNIFNPSLRVMGSACGEHTRYRTMCVLDYAGGFTPSARKGKR